MAPISAVIVITLLMAGFLGLFSGVLYVRLRIHTAYFGEYMSDEKNPSLFRVYGDYTAHLCRDYNINHDKDPY